MRKIDQEPNRKHLFLLLLLLFLPQALFSQETLPGPSLSVGSDSDYPPLSFQENEVSLGFDVDLIRLLEERMNQRLDHSLDTWPRILSKLEKGELQIVTGILYTSERDNRFDFTIPYIKDKYAIFAHKDAEIQGPSDLRGKRGAILHDDASYSFYLKPRGLGRDLLFTNSVTESLQAVNQGKADYTLAPYSLAQIVNSKEGLQNIQVAGRGLFRADFRLAVPHGQKERLFALNDALYDLIHDGTIKKLQNKWHFSQSLEASTVPPPSPTYIVILSVLAGMLLTLIAGGLFLLLRRPPQPGEKVLKQAIDNLSLDLWIKDDTGQYLWYSGAHQETQQKTQQEGSSYHETPLYKEGTFETIGSAGFQGKTKETDELKAKIQTLYQQLAEKEKRIQEMALIDSETGLFNRQYMEKHFQLLVQEYHRTGEAFCLLTFPRETQENPAPPWSDLLKGLLQPQDLAGISRKDGILILMPQTSLKEGQLQVKKLVKALKERVPPLTLPPYTLQEYREENQGEPLD